MYRRRLNEADEVVPFDHGLAELIQIGDWTVGRVTQEPGWRWSDHVRPLVGGDWCMTHHIGLHLSGRLHIRMKDGTEFGIEPGDLYDIPPGHDAWTLGDEPAVSFDFSGVRAWVPSRLTVGERLLATICFTDIVGSTRLARELGDRRWRQLLEQHDEQCRAVLAAFRGRFVKHTGDGLLALFDSAVRAVRCAAALRDRAAQLGLALRIGVHSGEVELDDGDLHGIAVHEAARITAIAGAHEILLSSTTQELAAGSDLSFGAYGSHELKGLSGLRAIYRYDGQLAPRAE